MGDHKANPDNQTHIMRYYSTLLLIILSSLCFAQGGMQYSRVEVDLSSHRIQDVAALGLEADHGHYAPGKHLINDFSSAELALLEEAGIPYTILIDDVQAHYREQNRHAHEHVHNRSSQVDCEGQGSGFINYVTPANYANGSMGGYLTYDELLETLDQMSALYPELITAKTPIDSISTHEGRPIHWLRISDNPSTDEDEPEVLYTALHHAREPNSLSQMIFYMWYLLENYDSDPEIQYLVDHTELYFIPCVNPDGYVYNELSDPDGGGLWRKNRYEEEGTVYGVDLNRNYGYEWGHDDFGSSPNLNSETYRGPEAFSEPETQAVRNFCNAHAFKVCLNYHTFGNLLIYPWGYNDEPTEDSDSFTAFAEAMTNENSYLAGTGTETVGYTVNGDSDDWMYGEVDSKPSIYSMTPEVGPSSYGFWPPESAIDFLNKSALRQNLVTAHIVLNYAEASEIEASASINETEGTLELLVKKYGLLDGDMSLDVSGLEGVDMVTSTAASSWTMTHLQEETSSFDYVLEEGLSEGDEVRFVVSLDNGLFTLTDTLVKTYYPGGLITIVEDNGDDLEAWDAVGQWSTTDNYFYSPPTAFADNNAFQSQSNSNAFMSFEEPIDLGSATQASLDFYARWDIEEDFDYVQVMASTDGLDYAALCGLFTNAGSMAQVEDEPLYDGTQAQWVAEQIDLGDYLGEDEVWIRFLFVSDGFVTGEGFYFDDLRVNISDPNVSVTEHIDLLERVELFPNPAQDQVKLQFFTDQAIENSQIRISDALGRAVKIQQLGSLSPGQHNMLLELEELSDGAYSITLWAEGQALIRKPFIKSAR